MNAKGRGSKAARIGALLDYIRAPERVGSDEKCAYYAGQGFVTDSPGGHRAEMIALAQDAPRSADPVNHYILSWREGEVPLPEQIEQAVSLFVDELGLRGHHVVYGLHADTDNVHLHVAVSRVHPDTLRVIKINRGFDIEAVHRAVARIEHAQGWMPERRTRYEVDEEGRVVRSPSDQAEPRRPTQAKCDREADNGQPSAERIAIEHAAPIIARAASWEALHAALADKGMRYERVGSGAKVFVGPIAVKASRVAREASFGSLEHRLGAYRPAPEGLRVSALVPRSLQPEIPEWERYRFERVEHDADKRAAWVKLRTRLRGESKALRERQRSRRQEILSRDFRGRGALLSGLRAALAEEQRTEGRALQRAHALERQELRARYRPFPGLEKWLRDQGQEVLAEQWRYRDSASRQGRPLEPVPDRRHAPLHTRYEAAWQAQEEARRQALGSVWAQHGRDVARLKSASKLRWAAVGLVSKGRLAGMLWASNARMADQRAWRLLHERHRVALRDAEQEHRPLEWGTWLQVSAAADARALVTPAHVGPPAIVAANVVAPDGRAGAGSADRVASTELVLHRVPGGTVQDDGNRLTLSREATQEAVAALLQLARARYGAKLGVDGDEVFRERLVQAAVASGLDVTFADPRLEARRQRLQRQHDEDQPRAHHPPRSQPRAALTAEPTTYPTQQRKGRSR